MDAIAFRNLADAAAAAGQTIEEFCADVPHTPADPGSPGQGNGNGNGPPASHGHP
jgi:hypothetical protein